MDLLDPILDKVDVTSAIVFLITFVLVYIVTRRHAGVPPGPPCWPVIGNLGSMVGKDTLQIFSRLRKKYGDIYGLYIGGELIIVLNGYHMIHNALIRNGTLFSKRPENNFTKRVFLERDHNLAFGDGHKWKKLRTFVLNSFNNLCFSKKSVTLEERVHLELSYFTKELKSVENPVDLSSLLSLSLANIIFIILNGHRPGYNSNEFKNFLGHMAKSAEEFGTDQTMHFCFPFLYWLPGDLLNVRKQRLRSEAIRTYLTQIVHHNIEHYKSGETNNLIDCWLEHSQVNKDTRETYHIDKLWVVLSELIGAGTETTSTVLKWLLLCVSLHPDVQKRLHNSIEKVVGMDRVPSLKDRKKLPYVEACIMEALRFGNVFPLAMPHSVPHDIIFSGYVIPKHSTILPNTSSVHMDPNIFPDPENFKPERFLSDDGSRIVKTNKLMPFSVGSRSCLGESISKIELFLFTTTLLQKFEFTVPDGQEHPSLRGVLVFVHGPQKYKLNVMERDNNTQIHAWSKD